jgi:hypothetical protein
MKLNLSLTIKIKNLSWGQHWSFVTLDVSTITIQEFYMKPISSMDFPQHGEVFIFMVQGLQLTRTSLKKIK